MRRRVTPGGVEGCRDFPDGLEFLVAVRDEAHVLQVVGVEGVDLLTDQAGTFAQWEPGNPQPRAGMTADRHSRSSAAARAFRVATRMLDAVAWPPRNGQRCIVDHGFGIEVERVRYRDLAQLDRTLRTAASSSGSPASLRSTPATPDPISRLVAAALTRASALWAAISPCVTLKLMLRGSLTGLKRFSVGACTRGVRLRCRRSRPAGPRRRPLSLRPSRRSGAPRPRRRAARRRRRRYGRRSPGTP